MAADFDSSPPRLSLPANEALPTEAYLKETLDLARETWALDFLFKLDPSADVGVLTSPGQLQHAIVVDTNESVFEKDGQYNGLFNTEYVWRWLVVPVMNVGEITAEIVVQSDEQISNETFVRCRGIATTIRMLRSNVTGTVLMSMENAEHNEISLGSFRIEAEGVRKRVFMRGKRDRFLEALFDPQGVNYQKMARSLMISDLTRDVSSCFKTAATHGFGSFSPVEFKKPMHPLDFATSRMNLICHGGRFSGVCTFNLLSEGVPFTTATLMSTFQVQACDEPGLVELLADVGIANKMISNAVVPRSVPMPASNSDVGLSFGEPDTVPGVHFNSPIGSFDGFSAFSTRSSLFEDLLGPTIGSTTTTSASAGHVDFSPSVPDSGVLHIEPDKTKSHSLLPANVAVQARVLVPATKTVDRKLTRQMKNREAAARSNARRKQRDEALRENLSVIRKKKCELELRESELKLENANLLKLINR